MGNILRIVDISRYFFRILPCKMPEHIFISFFACSQYYNLIILLTHFIHHIIDQIHPLLISQSGHNADHKRILFLRQSQFFLQCCFVFCLSIAEAVCRIGLIDSSVCFRIPLLIIQSIYDSSQIIGSGTHQSVQIFSIEWCLNLLCISRTDRCQCICIDQTTLQIIGISIKLHLIRRKIIIWKPGNILNGLHIPYSLKLQIVYRHNTLHIGIKRILMELALQKYRYQTCLPVMAVNNIWLESNHRQYRKCCLRKESKLLHILINIPIWLESCKVIFIINKIKMYSIVDRLKHTYILASPAKIHIKMGNISQLLPVFFLHAHILWKNHSYIKLIFIQILGKGSNNISQSPGLDKRHSF